MTRFLKARPDDEDAQIYKGEIEFAAARPSDAVNTLQAVLKNDPDNARGTLPARPGLRSTGQYRAGRKRNGARRFDCVLTLWKRTGRWQASPSTGAMPSALAQEADQIIALQPGAPDGYLLRGVAEIDRKQFATADEYIHRSLEKEPNNPAAYVQLGNLRMAQNQYAEAQKAYQQALDQDPNSTDALGGVLNVYLCRSNRTRPSPRPRAELAKYPKNAGFHIMLGQLLMEQKRDLAGAEQEFKTPPTWTRKTPKPWSSWAWCRMSGAPPIRLCKLISTGSKTNPKEIAFYLLAGSIYENKQDWEHAKQQYQKVLEIQPENPLASNNLAYVMLQQGGNVDVAFAMAQTARRQFPDNPNSADTLGWAFYHKHVYTSAITLFKEAVKKEPDNALFNYHLGLAYAKSGQAGLARQQLDRVVKIKPNFPEIEQLRQALAEAKG